MNSIDRPRAKPVKRTKKAADPALAPPVPSPSDLLADIQALHRLRFLAPICAGRRVLLLAPLPDDAHAMLRQTAAEIVPAEAATPASGAFDLILALTGAPTDPAALKSRLRAGGILAIAGVSSESLASRFAHYAAFAQRPIAGSLLMDTAFAGARMVPLRDGVAGEDAPALHLASDMPLPPLQGGLFEIDPARLTPDGAWPAPPQRPQQPLTQFDWDDALNRGPDSHADLAQDFRARAAGLVERLMDFEQTQFALAEEVARLKREAANAAASSTASFFDFPRTQHDWPLRSAPDRDPATLDLYDRRVDDPAIAQGQHGAAFFARFDLLSETPDFAGAVAALNAAPRVLHLHRPSPANASGGNDLWETQPDVSIIIPIYGQLAYTLNCLDSLFAHASKYLVEIIILDDKSPDDSAAYLDDVQSIRFHRNPENLGFIRTCNLGASMANGRYVIMLNNDTRAIDGWLDALIDSFEIFPKAGLVGSKLLYPDGALQEAGGIIWRGGEGWNYGRNDDPNRPQYSYARQVDFVSGCAIAIPIRLWRELGGFDLHYLPAYNEDSDFCMRLRMAGHEIWMQPQSRIIYYEGKTGGTDTTQGAKAYQIVNSKKFFTRWRTQLEPRRVHGQGVFFERERDVRRRVLIIDATTPTPQMDAGSVTTTLVLQVFQDLGYKTHFVPQDNMLFQHKHTTDLQRKGIECAYAPFDAGFAAYLRRYGWMFDIIQVFRVAVLEKSLPLLEEFAPQAPVLFNNMDLHYLRMERQAEIEGSESAMQVAQEMKERELRLMRQTNCTITPSTFEKRVLDEVMPDAPSIVLPFMMDFYGTDVGFAPRRDFVFLGGYGHPPNADAVIFFATEIFPLIKAKLPKARFVIAGARPTEAVLALASDDIIVTGMVPDLRDVFDTARVFVCPLRYGAGVKGKVAAAMSYGMPVVSTTIGAEGMDLVDGKDILLADDPAAFARACILAHEDRKLWNSLSRTGLRLVQENHSLAMGKRVMAQAIEIAYAHKLGLPTP